MRRVHEREIFPLANATDRGRLPPMDTLAVVLLIPLASYVGATAFVIGSSFWCWLLGRSHPKDERQAQAFFGRGASLSSRLWGCLREGWFQLGVWLSDGWRLVTGMPRHIPLERGTPVLLLPGYTETSGAMWWCLGRWLHAEGFSVHLVDFPSTFSPIATNVEYLQAQIGRVLGQTGATSVALVGHSMGGIIARAYVHSVSDHHVRSVVTLSSPHRGTVMAALGLGKSPKDMGIGSAHLERFPISARGPVPIHSLVGFQDHIVTPAWSAVTEEGDNHVLETPVGHVGVLFVSEARDRIRQWLLGEGVERGA